MVTEHDVPSSSASACMLDLLQYMCETLHAHVLTDFCVCFKARLGEHSRVGEGEATGLEGVDCLVSRVETDSGTTHVPSLGCPKMHCRWHDKCCGFHLS